MATAKSHEVYIYAKDKMRQGHLLYNRDKRTFFIYHSTPTPQFINLVNEDTNNAWLFSKLKSYAFASVRWQCYTRSHDSITSTLRVYDILDIMKKDWREAA